MHRDDFEAFRAQLNAVAAGFQKPIPDDLVVQTYWEALRDLSLDTFIRCAKTHVRFGKYFPKPAELRPADEKPDAVKSDGVFKAAVEDAQRWCDAMKRDGSALSMAKLRDAYFTRLMITTREDDPAFPEVKREWNRAGDQLRAAMKGAA